VDLSRRSDLPELMDGPDVSLEEHALCIADLAQINRVTFTHRPTLRWLGRATAGWEAGRALSVLDVAFGHGDLLRAIQRWARKRGLRPALQGVDLNPYAAVNARAAGQPDDAIAYHTADVFDFTPVPPADFIVTSQFTHHLTDPQVERFLQWIDSHAVRGWFIADLHRHALAYYGFPVMARLFGWRRIVRLDGRVSIARSFRPAEWAERLAAAGVTGEVMRRFPFRICVGHLR
jgi:SAM-dependent methyltransferase